MKFTGFRTFITDTYRFFTLISIWVFFIGSRRNCWTDLTGILNCAWICNICLLPFRFFYRFKNMVTVCLTSYLQSLRCCICLPWNPKQLGFGNYRYLRLTKKCITLFIMRSWVDELRVLKLLWNITFSISFGFSTSFLTLWSNDHCINYSINKCILTF